MKSEGKAACILPHGVLFRGNAEAVIRQSLVRSGMLKGIIGLPANLFYGTGIPACILVLDKENAAARRGVFMIDASKGFIKDGNKNRLREQNIHRIVDTFRKQAEVPRYARMVPFDEISDAKNDYNLNLPRYIDSTSPEDIQDIGGHLRGGIPERDIDALDTYWQVLPGVRAALFQPADRPGYSDPRLPIAEVKAAIMGHPEFTAFNHKANTLFAQWREANTPRLQGFTQGDHPKALIETIAEDLLATFQAAPLLDAYDVYQHLMDYWTETMQDDCYLIAADGWVAETHRVRDEVKSGKRKGEMKDKGWACNLVPKPYLVARYFAKEQVAIDVLQAELETVTSSLDELAEEHGGDEGVLKDVSTKADAQDAYTEALVALWDQEDKLACAAYGVLIETANTQAEHLRALGDQHWLSALKNANGKLTLKAIKDRLSRIPPGEERTALTAYVEADKKRKKADKEAKTRFAAVESGFLARLAEDPLPEGFGDLQTTVRYLARLDEQTELKAKLKAAEETLDRLAYEKYPTLTEAEVKTLVVDDKWLTRLAADVQGELDRVSQTLTGRVRQLAERYATPLPQLERDLDALAERVAGHLLRMGFSGATDG